MKKLMEWIKGYALTYAVDYLKNNKDKFVAKMNRKIDLPLLDEKKEAALLNAIFETVLEALDDKDTSK